MKINDRALSGAFCVAAVGGFIGMIASALVSSSNTMTLGFGLLCLGAWVATLFTFCKHLEQENKKSGLPNSRIIMT
jgi:hypothetical protein